MKRTMEWKTTPNGRVVSCTVCSWWIPVMGEDIEAPSKEFEAHVCAEHPPLKDIQQPEGD